MSEIASAFVTLLPSAKGFSSKLDSEIGGQVGGVGKKLGVSFGKAFAVGGALIAATGVTSFLKDSIGEAREAQKVGALTANVIKTTGGVANVSAKQVGALSSAISLKTGIDDEAIQSGSNLLLTFKNVRNEVGKGNKIFDRATQASADLSASGFGDLNGASKQLGKALNDPIKGITALGRSGVTFTDQQKEQIKTLVMSGKTLDAQKIILGEVESQVGGAAAATSTYGEKAGVAFGNIKEQVGTKLLPVIDGLAKAFLKSVPTITRVIDGIGPAFGRVRTFLAPFIAQVQGFFAGGGGGGFISGVTTVANAVRANLLPVLQTMATTFTTVILPAYTKLATYVITNLLPVFKQIVGIFVTQVLPIFRTVATFIYAQLVPAIVKIAGQVATTLKPVFDQLVTTMQTQVLPAVSRFLDAFQRAQPTIQKVVMVGVKVAGVFLKIGATILAKVLPVVIRFAGYLISNGVGAFIAIVKAGAQVAGALINFGKKLVGAIAAVGRFAQGVGEKIGNVVGFFRDLPGKITGAIKGLPSRLTTIGGQIIDGLVSGLRAAAHKVTDVVEGIINKIPKKIRSIMGIASPSKVTTILGEFIGEGLAKGILNSSTKITKAIGRVLDKAKEKVTAKIDDFRSLASSVADNFAGDLFSGFDSASGFLSNLVSVKGNLGNLLGAFKTLRGYGLPSSFLAKLFSDGGAPLILDLAANKDQAVAAAGLFSDITSLSSSLGADVATADLGGGKTLADLEATLKEINKNLQKVPDGVGDKVNSAATGGKKKGNKSAGGKKKR